MRFEINSPFLALATFILFIAWVFYKRSNQSPLSQRFIAFIAALTLPAFIPAHGEFIVAIPNGALLLKSSDTVIGIGLFFIFVYYLLIRIALHKIKK